MQSDSELMARARQLMGAGRMNESANVCRAILARNPDQVDAISLLGVIALQTGDTPQAVEQLQRAITLRPNSAELHVNLAPALQSLGRYEEAINACHRAIELDPKMLGAYQNLAQVLHGRGRFEEAAAVSRKGIAQQADYAPAYRTLAMALHQLGRMDEAERAGRRAVELSANSPQAWSTLGTILMDQGNVVEAVSALERAVSLRPSMPTSHYNYAMALLLSGDLQRGFSEYEWRWQCPSDGAADRRYPAQRWDGTPVPGKTVLLHAEQGLGDVIQMVRYAPSVAARCGRLVLSCQRELHRLLANTSGVAKVVDVEDRREWVDVQLPMMSLPRVFETSLTTIPANVPYVSADPKLARSWLNRMSGAPGNRRVGLAWAGNVLYSNDRNRSIPASLLHPLGDVPGISWYSLQKEAPGQGEAMPSIPLMDFTLEFSDLAETAAFMSNLDLVITVDTAIAHLAGAMGKPVWILLPFAPDWRWMRDRDDSPWYPTARLFRQPRQGDWESVISEVRARLR